VGTVRGLTVGLGLGALAACGLGVAGTLQPGDAADSGVIPFADARADGARDAEALDARPQSEGGDDGSEDARADVQPSSDAGADAPIAACLPLQVLCDGVCIPSTDCANCNNPSAKLLCKPTRTCVTSCGACRDLASTAMPIECFACNGQQEAPIGTCDYFDAGSFCLNGDYTTAYKGGPGLRCNCDNTDVANCPGRGQVCIGSSGTDWCTTCGENGLATSGLPCKGGGACNPALSPPRCQ
jgi:hypothetical protein